MSERKRFHTTHTNFTLIATSNEEKEDENSGKDWIRFLTIALPSMGLAFFNVCTDGVYFMCHLDRFGWRKYVLAYLAFYLPLLFHSYITYKYT